jgi:ADP-ribosyl-[dinitrogen reductase] hydrolase
MSVEATGPCFDIGLTVSRPPLRVNLGDDADTTGAVYGQLAGAFSCEAGIPAEWKSKLALLGTIEELAGRLHDAARG